MAESDGRQSPLTMLFDPRGRLSRRTYWLYVFGIVGGFLLLVLVLSSGDGLSEGAGVSLSVVYLAVLWAGIAMNVKRLHDGGKSGWFLFLSLIPLVSLYLLVLALTKGDPGPNQYGPNPEAVVDTEPGPTLAQ